MTAGSEGGAARSSVARLVPAAQPVIREPYGSAIDYPGVSQPPHRSGPDLGVYWRMLVRRRWLVIGVTVTCMALWTMQALMQTPLYTSTVRLQIDRQGAQILEGGNIAPVESGPDHEFQRTQFELLKSRSLAERVAAAEKLGEDVEFLKPRNWSAVANALRSLFAVDDGAAADRGAADRQRRATALVLAHRRVRPVSGSRLTDVSFSDPSPDRAQRIANAYADAFIADGLDKRIQANAYAKTFLEDQLAELKLRLEESEKALLAFAQKERIVSVAEKTSIAEDNLASANAALGTLVSERIRNEKLWRQVQDADAINLPQLLSNAAISDLRSRRSALVAEYEEKLETFKPAYPAMVQIDNRIKEIDRQLAAEVRTIKESFKAAYESSAQQEAAMREQIGRLGADVLDYQKRSIQYTILKREVDTTRALHNGLLQRYKEIDIAGSAGANNIYVVDRAERPASPSHPSLPSALVISMAVGLFGGILAAVLSERRDITVRSVEDLERLSGTTVLGLIPRAKRGKSIEAELNDTQSGVSEAYRSLCTSLQLAAADGLPETILLTSAGPSEGKSISALAIARHFASAGRKVLLIDADLRNPGLHIRLRLANDVGLTDYLTGARTPPETFQRAGIGNLTFMAAGPLPGNAADLLAGDRLVALLSGGREVFDLVVVDGPPVMGLADATLLSHAMAATLLVVGMGQARGDHLAGALRRLRLANANLIGSVLTKVDSESADYGYAYSSADVRYGTDRGFWERDPRRPSARKVLQ